MKQVIVKFCGCGIHGDENRVNLPTYIISEIIDGNKANILVPDDEVDNVDGIIKLSKDKIRLKYRGQSWDRQDVTDDVVV